MKTARIFSNGRSQAVRLPKEFRFDSDEVFVKKFNNIIMLIPKKNPWAPLIDSLDKFSDDYMKTRPILKPAEPEATNKRSEIRDQRSVKNYRR